MRERGPSHSYIRTYTHKCTHVYTQTDTHTHTHTHTHENKYHTINYLLYDERTDTEKQQEVDARTGSISRPTGRKQQ